MDRSAPADPVRTVDLLLTINSYSIPSPQVRRLTRQDMSPTSAHKHRPGHSRAQFATRYATYDDLASRSFGRLQPDRAGSQELLPVKVTFDGEARRSASGQASAFCLLPGAVN